MPRTAPNSNADALPVEGLDEWRAPNEIPIAAIPWLAAARQRTQAGLGSHAGAAAGGVRQRWPGPSRLQFKLLDARPTGATPIPYQASGGRSLLIRLDDGNEVQVELHLESYAVLWSSQLSASAAWRNLAPLLPGMPREVIAVRADGIIVDDDAASALDLITSDNPNDQVGVTFFRLDYEDRVVSWEKCQMNSPDTGLWVEVAQLGLLAKRFDADYLVALMRNTAPRLGVDAPALVRQAADVVRGSFPTAKLGDVPAAGDAIGRG